MGIVIAVVAAMGLVLYFSLAGGGHKTAKDIEPPRVVTENAPLMASNEGHGVAILPPEVLAETKALATEPDAKLGSLQFTIVGAKNEEHEIDTELEALQREQEELRRFKLQQSQAALVSPLAIKHRAVSMGNTGNTTVSDAYDGAVMATTSEYDPAADRDKEAFFERADHNRKDGWVLPYTREAGRQLELKTGTVIPGIMLTGVNSDLPGTLIAQVSREVFDTATGRFLLIPCGSKLYGVYDSRVVYGQERVLIAWNRLVFPNDSSVLLGAMPGVDLAGYAGFKDQVNNHYLRIFGSAAMMSLITGGMSYAMDSASNTDGDSTSVQDEMAAAFAGQMGQASLNLLQKNLSIKPTLEIRPGYVFNVVLTKDVVFKEIYHDR